MTALRSPSARPELVADETGSSVGNGGQVGFAGPLGQDRLLFALPNKNGPHQIIAALVLHDTQFGYLADPQGNLIGENNAVWIDRLLPATTTWNTRRL